MTVKEADLILNKFPDCPIQFANELQRLTNLQKNVKQDSAVVSFLFAAKPHRDNYLFKIEQEKRGIDTIWIITRGKQKILIILMPLTNRFGIEYYQTRINDILMRDFDIQLNGREIRFKSYQISSMHHPIDLLEDILKIK